MMGSVVRVMVALVAAGLSATLLFIATFSSPRHYWDYFVVLFPVVLLFSLPFGGFCYAVLTKLRVPLSLPVCIVTGAVVGALPGLVLWLLATIYPTPGAGLATREEITMYPLISSGFGAFGGFAFAFVARPLGLR